MKTINLKKIKEDLSFLSKYEVVIYGSFVEAAFRKESDIDIAIITRNKNREYNISLRKDTIGKAHPIYDIRIFELLPLKMKISVIKNYIALFGDRLNLSEYFYLYRKIWDDCKHRIFDNMFENIHEKIRLMEK